MNTTTRRITTDKPQRNSGSCARRGVPRRATFLFLMTGYPDQLFQWEPSGSVYVWARTNPDNTEKGWVFFARATYTAVTSCDGFKTYPNKTVRAAMRGAK